jgi:hypothetical protein
MVAAVAKRSFLIGVSFLHIIDLMDNARATVVFAREEYFSLKYEWFDRSAALFG